MSGGSVPDSAVVSARASGKVILLGEHAVVHGSPALALGIERGVVVDVARRPGVMLLEIPSTGHRFEVGDGSQEGAALAALVSQLGLTHEGMLLSARFEIPTRAGLGSSAALAGAAARAITALEEIELNDDELLEAVQASERIFHGNPSGLDATVALHGGIVLYSRSKGPYQISVPEPPPLAVFHSGEDGDTRSTVASFAERLEATGDEGSRRLARIGELVAEGLAALESGDWLGLGAAMNENHELLAWFGVSTDALDQLTVLAREAGALGAKLTGGGGGGCIAVLVEPGNEAVTHEVTKAGFAVVST